MTRINAGIKVNHLTDEHLLAEHREIKRIPQTYLKAIQCGSVHRIPPSFKLGPGHILFFIDKPRYTLNRYIKIHNECIKRGFDVPNFSDSWDAYPIPIPKKSEYIPSDVDRAIIIERITERLLQSTKAIFHYHNKEITAQEAVDILTQDLDF